jgi:hypothetical protein
VARSKAGSFTVTVTITNSRVTLAPLTVPAGSVVFNIVNRANSARDFEIAGKKTPMIATGRSATLRVEVTKRPSPYFSVGPRQARLSGLVGVLVACTKPTTSTVDVQIISGKITLSHATVPCGTVTFVVTNKEDPATQKIHEFDVDVPTDVKGGASSPRLLPGQTAKVRISFPFKSDQVYYACRQGRDFEMGEEGFLVVD